MGERLLKILLSRPDSEGLRIDARPIMLHPHAAGALAGIQEGEKLVVSLQQAAQSHPSPRVEIVKVCARTKNIFIRFNTALKIHSRDWIAGATSRRDRLTYPIISGFCAGQAHRLSGKNQMTRSPGESLEIPLL